MNIISKGIKKSVRAINAVRLSMISRKLGEYGRVTPLSVGVDKKAVGYPAYPARSAKASYEIVMPNGLAAFVSATDSLKKPVEVISTLNDSSDGQYFPREPYLKVGKGFYSDKVECKVSALAGTLREMRKIYIPSFVGAVAPDGMAS